MKNFRINAAIAVKIPTRKLKMRINCFSLILFSRQIIKRCNKLIFSFPLFANNLNHSTFIQFNDTRWFRTTHIILPEIDNVVYRRFYFFADFIEIGSSRLSTDIGRCRNNSLTKLLAQTTGECFVRHPDAYATVFGKQI